MTYDLTLTPGERMTLLIALGEREKQPASFRAWIELAHLKRRIENAPVSSGGARADTDGEPVAIT